MSTARPGRSRDALVGSGAASGNRAPDLHITSPHTGYSTVSGRSAGVPTPMSGAITVTSGHPCSRAECNGNCNEEVIASSGCYAGRRLEGSLASPWLALTTCFEPVEGALVVLRPP